MTQDHASRSLPGPAGLARPIRAAALVIYGTFVLLILTIPQGLVNWLGDMETNPIQEVVLRGAEMVQTASHSVGLDVPYLRARATFFKLTGKSDD
jgi:hypothetical protein